MKQSINLLESKEDSFLCPSMMKKIIGAFVGLLGVAIVLMLGILGYQNVKLKMLDQEITSFVSKASDVKQDPRIQILQMQKEALEEKMMVNEAAQAVLASKVHSNFSNVLKSLAGAHTQGVWITSIQSQTQTKDIKIMGKAQSTKQLMQMLQNLKNQPQVKGMKLEVMEITQASEHEYDFILQGQHAQH